MMNLLIKKMFSLIIGQASACPLCMGQNPNDKYFFYVIVVFILLATLAIIYLLKTCIRYKNINNKELEKDLLK